MDKTRLNLIKEKIILSSVVGASVKLRGRSPNFLGLCPFHQEKTPSFHVRDNKGRWKCFGCGASGDVFEFLMKQRGISFKEAFAELAEIAGIPKDPRRKEIIQNVNVDVKKAQSIAQIYFVAQLTEKIGERARNYLIKDRGLQEKMIKQAGLGFGGMSSEKFLEHLRKHGVSERCAIEAGLIKEGSLKTTASFSSRITFPIRDFDGRIIAFAGRSFMNADENAPKYLNTHSYSHYEKRKNFYGVFESKAAMLKGIPPVLVEGYFDAMAMWALGVPALALCGTAFSHDHANFLSRLSKRVLVCFDNDNAGLLALKQSLIILFQQGFTANLIVLDKKDPGDYLSSNTLDDLKTILHAPTDALCFLIERCSINAQKNIDERMRNIDSLLAIFSAIKRPLVRRQYVAHFAKYLHEDPALLWEEINLRSKRKIKEEVVKKNPLKLDGTERLLLEIAFSDPLLVDEMKELLEDASVSVTKTLEAILAINVQHGRVDNEEVKSKIAIINEELWPIVEEIIFNGIRFSREEALSYLEGLKNKIAKKRLKDSVREKRLEVQHFEKTGDFSRMLVSLREKRDLLSSGRQKPILLGQEEKPPVENTTAVSDSKKSKKIKSLSEEPNFFDPAEDWY